VIIVPLPSVHPRIAVFHQKTPVVSKLQAHIAYLELQNDFKPGDALAVVHGDEALLLANRLALAPRYLENSTLSTLPSTALMRTRCHPAKLLA
jgi:hypothetical protein